MELDVTAARALTPGCEHVLHLNHAGASLLPQPVLDAVTGHLELEARIGGYEAEAAAEPAIEHARDALATLIGARPDEIALMDSASRAWTSVVAAFPFEPGQAVVVTRAEYGANALTLLHLRDRLGFDLELVDDDPEGQVDLDALEALLARRPVALVSLVHVPTQSGLVNPAAEVGALCRVAGVPFVLDASQSIGQLPLDVDELGCGVLTGTARKFLRGPRGVGFAYIRASLLPRLRPTVVDLRGAEWTAPDRYEVRDDARRFEMWECDVAGRIGLGAAIDHALGWGLPAIGAYDERIGAALRDRLRVVPRVEVQDRGERLCGIVTFTVDGIDSVAVRDRLRAQHINVFAPWASTALLDLGHRGLDKVVRASVHYTTTGDEVDRFVAAVSSIAAAPGS